MKYISHFVLVASALILAGCQKNVFENGSDTGDVTVKYAVATGLTTKSVVTKKFATEVSAEAERAAQVLSDATGSISISMVAETTEGIGIPVTTATTKGTQVNTTSDDNKTLELFADVVGTFYAKAYDGSGIEKVSQTVTWSPSSSAWIGTPTRYWPQGTDLSFLGYANLPSGQTATIAYTGVSTEHTVPATASEQIDILFGHYSGNGGNTGTAEIRFDHPLTAVRFKYGTMDDDPVIQSISLSGVAESGTATKTPDGTVAWSDVDSYGYTVSQSDDSGLSVDATTSVIGEPFLIIPQNLADNAVKVTVTFTDGTVVEGTLTSGDWKAGYTNTYTLGYDPQTYTYTFDLQNDDDAVQLFINTTSAKSETIPVISKRIHDEESENHDWLIDSYQVVGEESVNVNATSFSGVEGLTVERQGTNLKVTSATKQAVSPGTHSYWINSTGREDHLGWSPADWTDATSSNPIDLSKFNFATDTQNAHSMTTANCYVIRHAGTYKFPLVYGNAVVNGSTNEQAYYVNSTSGSNRLTRFVNHSGNGITSPFIENNGADCVPTGCAIIWQDVQPIVKNLTLVGETSTSYDASNVRYLQFNVDKSNICQSNALVCIYKDLNGNREYDNGEAIWSWQIWITNDPDLSGSAVDVTSAADNHYMFFPLNSIGWIDSSIYWERKNVSVVLKQKDSGNTETVVIRQPRVYGQSNGSYFQYGRKDPLSRNNSNWTQINNRQEIPYSIKNPTTFISGRDNYDGLGSDWCTFHYYNLWTGKKSVLGSSEQDADMIKTIYDPSPVGYKVPASGGFTGFTRNGAWRLRTTSGYYYFTRLGESGAVDLNAPLIYFPAVGYRANASGGLWELGDCGDFWSVNPAKDYSYSSAYFLEFYLGKPAELSHFYRSYGFNVRPVKE